MLGVPVAQAFWLLLKITIPILDQYSAFWRSFKDDFRAENF
jgi:hypothetical protein